MKVLVACEYSGTVRDAFIRLPPSVDRWKLRSVTFQGFADAMANQWGVDADFNLV